MTPCPSEKQLRRWLAGGVNDADSQTIEAHVESCPDVCQPLLDSFSGFEDDAPEADTDGTAASAVAPAGGTPAPQATDFPNLPGYEILGQLGKGGMGVVFKARHRRMDRLVAIKVLPAAVTQDPDAIARFEREVKAAARLQHPNIVAAYDAAEANGVYFLAMEYVEGTDLSALVRHKGPFWVSRAVDCVLQAARGLDYAHRHGVVHRDVKPSNLLLDSEGVVKVLDMGLARFETSPGADVTELTGMGQIMGTVDYMAPEQALDTRHADARSDIYSLGITLWYLLTGRPAFFGENALARLLAHREQPIPSLLAACAPATPALEAVFMKMVAKKPENRYQTMSAVIAALEDSRRATGEAPTQSLHDVGWAERACERWPTESGVTPGAPLGGTAASAVPVLAAQPHPQAGTRAVLHASLPASADATLTLNAAELDTDPNTEQSLDISASALAPKPRRRGRKFGIAAALLSLAALLAAAFVIRVQTGEGEVVVESEVDGISLDILRNGEPLKGDWQIHAGADNRWHVRTGTVEVKLPANLQGEFTLDQDTARLIRDGKIAVKITRKRTTDTPEVAAEDRDRSAAEWVLAQGGKVEVTQGTTFLPLIERSADLPIGPITLTAVILHGCATLKDEDLDRFVGLDGLYNLSVADTPIGPAAVPALAAMRGLNQLEIAGTRITTSALPHLGGLPQLQFLAISTSQVNDHWEGLRPLHLVRELSVIGVASPDDLQRFSELPQLRSILLADVAEVDPQMFAVFKRKNPLCRLVVDARSFKVIGEDYQRTFAERLQTRGAKLKLWFEPDKSRLSEDVHSGTGPVDVRGTILPPNCALQDDDFRLLSCLPKVHFFTARAMSGADRLAAAFDDRAMLAGIVDLSNSDLTDAGLTRFAKLAMLDGLDIRGTKVTAAGVEAFKKAMPDCKVKWDSAVPPTQPAADRDRAAAEWVLAQGGKVAVSQSATIIEHIADLPDGLLTLWDIILGNPTLKDEDLDRFVGLPALTNLRVMGAPLGPAAVNTIARMRGLQILAIQDTHIPTSALAELHGLLKLIDVTISARQVDDNWAALRKLRSLRDLHVAGTASSNDLQRLAEISQLRNIRLLNAGDINPETVAVFEVRNPLCRLVVGEGRSAKVIGKDHQRALAEQLLARGAKLKLAFWPDWSQLSEDLHSSDGLVVLREITLPSGCSLTVDDLRLFGALTNIADFSAPALANADRCAAALGDPASLVMRLNLSKADLTDAGLARLANLPRLEWLDIRGTKVTARGVEAFKKALPDCKVQWDSAVPPTQPAVDRDRAAAEWLLAQGGKFTYVAADGTGALVSSASDVPATPFQLHVVDLWGVKTVRNEDLDRFVGLTGLGYCWLDETDIDRDAIARLIRIPTLRSLGVSGTRIKSSQLGGLAALSTLNNIGLKAGAQIDDDWTAVQQLLALRELSLHEAAPDDVRRLGRLSRLRTIFLPAADEGELAAAVEEAVAELQVANPLCRVLVGGGNLVYRAVGRDPESELARRLLASHASLSMVLAGQGGKADDEYLAAGKPVCICSIELPPEASLMADDLDHLSCSAATLVDFFAHGAQGADRYAAALAGNASLVNVEFTDSDLSDAGLDHLKPLAALTTLDVQGTKVTAAGVEKLHAALPRCRIISDHGTFEPAPPTDGK